MQATLEVQHDLVGLARRGLCCYFDQHALKKHEDPALLKYQDELAETLTNLIGKLVQARCTSGTQHSCTYPGKLTPWLRPEHETQVLEDLRRDVAAWREAEKRHNPVVKAMCKVSPFRHPVLQWIVIFMEAAQWKHVPP